jgi:tetratricopeptide (TPR) repeat protein/predicted AlkP superfamily pyrophosphatase or phosphodiesterase
VAIVVFVALLTACGGRGDTPPVSLVTDEAPARVVFVGLDGLDWGLLDRLIAAGRCPTFARMKAEGAWADLHSEEPYLSPLIWTTIATGRPPEVHGILDFVVTDPTTGSDVPISNRFREVPAFWNVLSANARTVDVVNWWATHPAEEIAGVMVSERPFYQLFGLQSSGLPEGSVTPADAIEPVRSWVVPVDAIGWDRIAPYVELDQATYDARVASAAASANPFDDRLMHLRKILAATDGVFAIGRWLLAERPADLVALYIEGTDTVGHRFAHYMDPPLAWVDQDERRAFRHVMPRYYEDVDRQLGDLMAGAPADVTWIVAADHGFQTGAARPSVPPDDFSSGAARWHRSVGVFLASGPLIQPGEIASAHIGDLCRTLLWLAGAPISDELEGRELVELAHPAWAQEHPPIRVVSYAGMATPWRDVDASGSADDDRLAELEALGYVVRDDADSGPGGEEKATALFNRAKLAARRGDYAEAARWYEATVDRDPRFFWAMMELYGLSRKAGDHERALYWVARAMQTGDPRLPDRLPVAFVREAIDADRLSGAMEVVRQMPPRWQTSSSYHAALGLAAEASGSSGEALESFQRALDLDAGDLDALDGVLRLARTDAAIQWKSLVDAAYDASRTDLVALRRLGAICRRFGQNAAAERCLRQALASDPADTEAMGELVGVLAADNRPGDAADMLERYLELEPDNPAAWETLADLAAKAGRTEQETEARQRADELRAGGR